MEAGFPAMSATMGSIRRFGSGRKFISDARAPNGVASALSPIHHTAKDTMMQNTDQVTLGQEQYEELQHVLDAYNYQKASLVDLNNAMDGIYKIERWSASGKPTILVTIGDNHLIELWASPELWGDGVPRDSSKVVAYLQSLLDSLRAS